MKISTTLSNIKDNNRRKFAAMMSALDDQLTSVIEKFKEKGMWDDTILVGQSYSYRSKK